MTKKILNLLYFVIPVLMFSQRQISMDENGRVINQAEFQKKWRDKKLDLFRWDYMENKKRVCTLKKGMIQSPEMDYDATLQVLEKKLNTKFTKNAIVVLDFWYYNDICSESRDDVWPAEELREIKSINYRNVKAIREKLLRNNQNLYVFYIFEKNTKVTKPDTEYFKSFVLDSDNFFRETYFKEQAMCGSNLIITPSGTLLYNGEATMDDLLNEFIN